MTGGDERGFVTHFVMQVSKVTAEGSSVPAQCPATLVSYISHIGPAVGDPNT